MADKITAKNIKHINSVIKMCENYLVENNQNTDGPADGIEARTKTLVYTICGENSTYYEYLKRILNYEAASSYIVQCILGLLIALKGDLLDGFLISLSEVSHEKLFTDYIKMAEYLNNDEGLKDAAAVIVGSTLEAHLRLLCQKTGVATNVIISGNEDKPKKAEQINQELGKRVYSLYDQKQVTAWLDLRNNAAHGKYSSYTGKQVELMIEGIKDFIKRYPA